MTLYCFLHGKLPYCEKYDDTAPEILYKRILKQDYIVGVAPAPAEMIHCLMQNPYSKTRGKSANSPTLRFQAIQTLISNVLCD